MRKIFTLMGALLLWHTVAVAQNYLHIFTGDTTQIVRLAELDSVTIRDANFYKFDINSINGKHYTAQLVDNWERSFYFDVTVTVDAEGWVYLQNLDPYFVEYGYTASAGYNILKGEYTLSDNGTSAIITCQPNQGTGYPDATFVSGESTSSAIVFTVNEHTLTCDTGFGVMNTGKDTYYSFYNPFTLKASSYAPALRRDRDKLQQEPAPAPQKQGAKEHDTMPLKVMPAPKNQIIE